MSISMVLLIGVVVFGYTNGFDIKNILSGQGMVEDRLVYDHNKKDAAKEAQATEKNNNTAIVTIDTQQAKIAFAQENSVDVASLQPIEGTNSYRVPIPTENIKLPPAYSADYKISKNITYRALATPNDPLFSQQWHLTKVSSPAAWDISTGLPSAKVAVIDTGFALNHQDLSAKLDIANAYDFANNDDNNVDFGIYVELQTLNPEEINIQEFFNISNSQISSFGRTLFDNDIPENLKIMLSKMSWGIRTYINFQDIFDMRSELSSYHL